MLWYRVGKLCRTNVDGQRTTVGGRTGKKRCTRVEVPMYDTEKMVESKQEPTRFVAQVSQSFGFGTER
jgi:hypothetical protein